MNAAEQTRLEGIKYRSSYSTAGEPPRGQDDMWWLIRELDKPCRLGGVPAESYRSNKRVLFRDEIDEQIVQFITRGLPDKSIAKRVCLAPQTVRNRVSRMLYDAEAGNRSELAALYLTGHFTFYSSGRNR